MHSMIITGLYDLMLASCNIQTYSLAIARRCNKKIRDFPLTYYVGLIVNRRNLSMEIERPDEIVHVRYCTSRSK